VPSAQFSRDLAVSADADTCWKVLTDVPRLVDWISIVDQAKEVAELERYTAVLLDRLGPFKLKADLDIVVSEVETGRHIRVKASGEDRQVASRIAVDATMALQPGDTATTVAVAGTYEVVGRVATLGAGMIKSKADKIINEFFARAAAELGAV
jgi:uncharacterized protein